MTICINGLFKSERGQNQHWLPQPCLIGGPKEGGNATSPLHSRGSPTPSAGTKLEVATSPLPSRGSPTKGTRSKWAQKRAEMLHHPCILGGPQTNGDKIRIGRLNPAFWGTHKWAEMLPQPCFLRDTHQRRRKQSTKNFFSNGVLDPTCGPVVCPCWGLNLGLPAVEALLYH